MKYIFTKSMERSERCNLSHKLYEELIKNTKYQKILAKLDADITAKKKKRLYGNKNVKVHSINKINFKGVIVYSIITENKGVDIVFNSSPVDASYSEYIRISPSGIAILYSQHLLDRYNERMYDKSLDNHTQMMKELFIQNPSKANIAHEGEYAVQRIDDGFLLGKRDEKNNNIIFNTFYDSAEYKDNFIKENARMAKTKKDSLTNKQREEYDVLLFKCKEGLISKEDFKFQINQKGLI